MNRRNIFGLYAIAIVGLAFTGEAHSQSTDQLVGTWQLVSNVNTAADGTKTNPYGNKPLGIATYTADGHFTQILVRPDIPKIASNNRMQATSNENKEIVQGSLANFGTYALHGKELDLKVEGSTYPNWIGIELKWNVSVDGDNMEAVVPASVGGSSDAIWKRFK